MKKKKNRMAGPEPKRLAFPKDETENQWLPILLDAYHITDKGVYEGVRFRLSQGQILACEKGCATCCTTHTTIPVYPLELAGIYWYAIEKLQDESREKLKTQLRAYTLKGACPFLIDGMCGIHPMRPMACRNFNVFTRPCDEGEDPYYTRRDDVLTPLIKYKDKALAKLLPFHGIKQQSKIQEAMKKGVIHTLVQNLRELDWIKLADRMADHPTDQMDDKAASKKTTMP